MVPRPQKRSLHHWVLRGGEYRQQSKERRLHLGHGKQQTHHCQPLGGRNQFRSPRGLRTDDRVRQTGQAFLRGLCPREREERLEPPGLHRESLPGYQERELPQKLGGVNI